MPPHLYPRSCHHSKRSAALERFELCFETHRVTFMRVCVGVLAVNVCVCVSVFHVKRKKRDKRPFRNFWNGTVQQTTPCVGVSRERTHKTAFVRTERRVAIAENGGSNLSSPASVRGQRWRRVNFGPSRSAFFMLSRHGGGTQEVTRNYSVS